MKRDLKLEHENLIKNTVAKSLKEIGFKKSGLTFIREADNFVQTCRVHNGKYNCIPNGNKKFTIHFGFFFPRLWNWGSWYKFELPTHPSPAEMEQFSLFGGRLGYYIYGHDYWYELNEETTCEMLEKQVLNDIKTYLIPTFQELQTTEAFLNIEHSTQKLLKEVPLLVELEFGNFEKGKERVIAKYKEVFPPQMVEHRYVNPLNGQEEVMVYDANDQPRTEIESIVKRYKIDIAK